MARGWPLIGLALLGSLFGCDPAAGGGGGDAGAHDAALGPPEQVAERVVIREADALAELARGAEQNSRVCQRSGSDLVRDLVCDDPDAIGSLTDLQEALGIEPGAATGAQGFAMTGHSTALGARGVSAINPRIIFVKSPRLPAAALGRDGYVVGGENMLALAFTRGEQTVEFVARDRQTDELRFSLLSFRQECNDSPQGCSAGDLLTQAVEKDWTEVTLYEEKDLANTILDCRHCHQPDGPGTPRILRMQELPPPWTHWFMSTQADDRDDVQGGGPGLFEDYDMAKAIEPGKVGEGLAGVSYRLLREASPVLLSIFVAFGNEADSMGGQPNEFPGDIIAREMRDHGDSETWRELYEVAKRGDAIPVPYPAAKVADPDKLRRMAEAYRSYLAGDLPRHQLPDIRKVFPDDPELLSRMGFTTEPGLDGEGVLTQACAQCHNDRLDQNLTRARFSVNLSKLDRAAKDRAIERINLPRDDIRAMPPERFRTLSDEARTELENLLMR